MKAKQHFKFNKPNLLIDVMSNSEHSDDENNFQPLQGIGEENLFTELEQISPRGVQVEDCTEEQLIIDCGVTGTRPLDERNSIISDG